MLNLPLRFKQISVTGIQLRLQIGVLCHLNGESVLKIRDLSLHLHDHLITPLELLPQLLYDLSLAINIRP
uniref:Uncharacterized protein n=1 Tax=Arundo donax TaxID=35708 RepID=A0A0A9CQ55_ARUDO